MPVLAFSDAGGRRRRHLSLGSSGFWSWCASSFSVLWFQVAEVEADVEMVYIKLSPGDSDQWTCVCEYVYAYEYP